jgi:hypothetical protein
MPKQVKFRRGTTAQHAGFVGAAGEVTMDTDKKTLVVHDGLRAGGFALAREAPVRSVVLDPDTGLTYTLRAKVLDDGSVAVVCDQVPI